MNKRFKEKMKISGFAAWIFLVLYTWFVIIYGTNSAFTTPIEKRAPIIHSLNMSYYEIVYPWIYQDYTYTDEAIDVETSQESTE